MRSRERCIDVLKTVNPNVVGGSIASRCIVIAKALEQNLPYDESSIGKLMSHSLSPTLHSLLEDSLKHWKNNGRK
jgi:hypothetical protein